MADETRDALIKLAQAVDRLAFAMAGLAAYVAHLPDADAVDVPAVKEAARDFIPEPVYRGFVPPLIVETFSIIDRIEAAAKAAVGQPGKGA